MREREVYSDIRVPPPIIIRIDGRKFEKVLEKFEKPYDEGFARCMANASELFLKKSGFNPEFAYTFSDEISIFFRTLPFDGRVEKLDSVIPSFFSSVLTKMMDFEEPISFDSRIIPICTEDLIPYLAERQNEAWRNHLNSYAFYTLLEEGLSRREASKKLEGMKSEDIHEMLFRRGINLNSTPSWQRRGILIAKEIYEKEGFDPKMKKRVIAQRIKIVQIWDLPLFKSDEGRELIDRILTYSKN
ncbi:MAG: tRNA(His) guanylyltransferase Thg1 family protein [Candidatus Syntropharchaeia archaeon]